MRNAYADVLENLVQNLVFPDGTICDPLGNMTENLFSVYDIDNDGKEEMILLYSTTYMAGYAGYVFDYDGTDGSIRTQLLEFPDLIFYDNGAVMAGWSHNQGWGGRFWPYNLYQYDPDSDSYTMVGMVDAWDREISDNNEGFTPFPTELDVSGTGFLYYIYSSAEEFGNVDPVDASVYQTWLNGYIGGASELKLTYQTMTEENIQNLRSGT